MKNKGSSVNKPLTTNQEDEESTGPGFIRLSGMVWAATVRDVKNLLSDCKVSKVHLIRNNGKATGDGIVMLDDEADVEKALRDATQKYINFIKYPKFEVKIRSRTRTNPWVMGTIQQLKI